MENIKLLFDRYTFARNMPVFGYWFNYEDLLFFDNKFDVFYYKTRFKYAFACIHICIITYSFYVHAYINYACSPHILRISIANLPFFSLQISRMQPAVFSFFYMGSSLEMLPCQLHDKCLHLYFQKYAFDNKNVHLIYAIRF